MGFRFQKRILVLPGVSISLGCRGVPVSIGPKGAKTTIVHRGIKQTVGAPGTDIRYETASLERGVVGRVIHWLFGEGRA